jgi:transcriptional regulator with XRE-family HTH domain
VTLGANIRRHRRAQQMRQKELAARSGVPQSMISAYELDKSVPSVPTLKSLAKALRVSLDDLAWGPQERPEAADSPPAG